jgi:hypothetical protein
MKKHCRSITLDRIPMRAQVDTGTDTGTDTTTVSGDVINSTVPGTTGLGVKLQMVEMTVDTAFVMGRAKFMNGMI